MPMALVVIVVVVIITIIIITNTKTLGVYVMCNARISRPRFLVMHVISTPCHSLTLCNKNNYAGLNHLSAF